MVFNHDIADRECIDIVFHKVHQHCCEFFHLMVVLDKNDVWSFIHFVKLVQERGFEIFIHTGDEQILFLVVFCDFKESFIIPYAL